MGTFLRQLSLQHRQRDDDLPLIESEILERASRCSSSRKNSFDSSFAVLNTRNSQIRDLYTRLLIKHSLARAAAHPDVAAKGAAVLFTGNAEPSEIEGCVLASTPTTEVMEAFTEGLQTLNLVAPPSGNAAHFIARTAALRYIHLLEDEIPADNADIPGPSNRFRDPIEAALNVSALDTVAGWVEGDQRNRNETDLITVGLSSTFSVLLELNEKDSDLCVRALQSLLNVLQYLPPESFAHTSHEMVNQMHLSLRQLRQKGNEQVSEYATACMLSLSIACGTPELLFATISTLFCDHKESVPFNQLDTTLNPLSRNFQRLALTVQRTIQRGPAAIALNPNLQNWWLRPLTEHNQISEFELVYPGCLSPSDHFTANDLKTPQGCICSDGPYIYLLTVYGLFKMGTGLGETRGGKVMAHNDLMKYSNGSSLIYCNESLYLRRSHSTRLWVIDRLTLREIGEIMLSATLTEGLLYADGRQFFHAVLDSQWNFISIPLDDTFSPSASKSHRISCRLMDIGYAAMGDFNQKQLTILHSITSTLKNAAVDLQLGTDVGFILTRAGKIHYCGHGETFGLTYSPDQWLEITLEESIVSFTLDSHANCLIMRSGSGSLYAIGSLSNMFEANPQKNSKKVRKIRIPNRRKCVSISGCGGAMAFASDNGQCFLHGRHIVNAHSDTIHANFGMENVAVASVGLGKTHLVVISKSGLVYTCGLNNLNQCGRTETASPELRPHLESPHQSTSSNVNSPSHSQYCPPNAHTFVKDVATICLKCGCCSARGKNCPYGGKQQNPNVQGTPIRPPIPRGSPCACGAGESACLRCGICRQCGRQKGKQPETPSEDTRTSNPSTSDENDDQIEDLPMEKPRPQLSRLSVNNSEAMATPGRVVLMKKSNDIKVSSVSVGNYHTVLLCADHQVYTFGCNNNGQLGTGDTSRRTHPFKVPLPLNVQIVQAVAGANHCVLRTMNGEVITFGAHRAGQLGRECENPEDRQWFAKPGFVPEFGPQTGKTASWVSAKGDRTLIQSHQRLFSRNQLDECQIIANKSCLALIPNCEDRESFCVMIPTKGAERFYQFQMPLRQNISWCFNPIYDILWSFDAERVCIQGFTDGPSLELQNVEKEPPFFCEERKLLQSTELCIPTDNTTKFSDEQLAIFLISTVYGLSLSALAAIPQVTILQSTDLSTTHEELSKNVGNANFVPPNPVGCNVINRFLTLGGGWGYSVHCLEAIQFKVNKDINLYGFGLYGGHGENSAKIKLFRNVGNTDRDENNVELISETNEVLYDCPIKETAFIGFRKPILVNADVWYVAWVQIQGPSSDCGAEGQPIVRGDSDVEFEFRNSGYSNNGTDVEGGQIPEIYYKPYQMSSDKQRSYTQPSTSYSSPQHEHDASIFESVALSAQTVFSITADTMKNLFKVLEWGMHGSFQCRDYEKMQDDTTAQKQEQAAFVTIITMRIIRIYLGVIFPQRRADYDSQRPHASSECVYEFKRLLDELFRTADERLFVEDRIGSLVVEEAVDMFVSCSYLLTPSPEILSIRLSSMITKGINNWQLLSTLKAFCRLEEFVLPIMGIRRQELALNDILQNLIDYYTQKDGLLFQPLDSEKMITFLFHLSFASVDIRSSDLLGDRLKTSAQTLLVIIAKQLVNSQLNLKTNTSIYQTPRRFRQTVCQPNWETGNDAADSIALKVDCHGIQLQGIGMYPSSPKSQRKVTYDIEVLEAKGDSERDGWISLARCNGVAHEESTAEGNECVLIRLNKPIPLKPNVAYAVKALIDAGKTFFGEAGISVVKLQRHGRMTFLPSSFSKNGTTVSRGQLPFFLYSIENSNEANFNTKTSVSKEANRLFLLIIRLLSSKLSIQLSSAVKDSFPTAKMCSQLVVYATVYMEANPSRAYHVIAAFDQVLPLISAANADFDDEKGSSSTSFNQIKSDGEDPAKSLIKRKGFVQAVVESAHPYKTNDFTTHFVSFDPTTEFVCVRFHEACQTAHPGDSLWVYGVAGDRPTNAFYAVGRYSVNREWPEGVLVIPGNNVWFVFESGPESEERNNAARYGFRCTVEGITSLRAKGSTTLSNLETEFAWLCSKACNIMVQSTNRPNRPSSARDCYEVIQKHGVLLQKGLNLDHVPNVAELARDSFPSLRKSDDLQFLADFISASPDTLGGLLATALVTDSYIDVAKCKVEVEPLVGFVTNQPIRLSLVPLTQYGEVCLKNDLQVQFTVKKGATESSPVRAKDGESGRIFKTLTVFKDMFKVGSKSGDDSKNEYYEKIRQLQLEEPFRPAIVNNNRFMSIGCNPKLADYSFEELRWAYELGSTTTETLKVDYSSSGGYQVQWTPLTPGRYHVEASIDGFDISSRSDFNIKLPTMDVPQPVSEVPPTPRHRPKPVDPANILPLSKATCPAVSGYAGVRIRSHPTLNAQQIGAIPRGATISYVETLRNTDGMWLRLSDDVKALYCERKSSNQAWSLQYNNHLKIEHLTLNHFNGNVESGPVTTTRSTVRSAGNKPRSSDSTPLNTEDNPMRPLTVECFRAAFAAFAWHERLVQQLIECANNVADMGENPRELLAKMQSSQLEGPANLTSARNLWSTMSATLTKVVKQHLIIPSPTVLRRPYQRQRINTADRIATDASNENGAPIEELCELCGENFPKPVTAHMRVKHPGCRGPCLGHGYNSVGNYTTGWTGMCGEGGKGNAVWYLLCPNCRTEILAKKENQVEEETDRRWREFRQINATQLISPEVVIRRNSVFLLGLCPTGQRELEEAESKRKNAKTKWIVDLYPSGDLNQTSLVIENDKDEPMTESNLTSTHRPRQLSQTSDPGVSHQNDLAVSGTAKVPTSYSVSGNVFRKPFSNYLSTIDALPEEDEDEANVAGPSSMPNQPPTLNEVVTNFSNSVPSPYSIHSHPVLAFIVENHDLSAIAHQFEDNIKRAVILAHAFKVWNWLLKLVTSESSVMDIVWQYLNTMFSFSPNYQQSMDMKFATKLHLLPHPWRLCFLAGDLVTHRMVEAMHSFLATLYVILNADNVDIRLKCLCFRSWTFQLTIHEQDLLYTLCKLLCKVGDVLADTSTDTSLLIQDEPSPKARRKGSRREDTALPIVKQFDLLNQLVKLDSSSQKQILHCLLDGSHETFWESGEEDNNRSSYITVGWAVESCMPAIIGVFIDNVQDSSYRVCQVNFTTAAANKGEGNIITLNAVSLSPKFVGWVRCTTLGTGSPLRIHIKFNGRSCRLRQIVVLGQSNVDLNNAVPESSNASKALKGTTPHQLSFSSAQFDAFSLFQAVAAQAFSDEFAEDENGHLRQQVIEMLFNRVQLQPLQIYVCTQIVTAVEREITNLRDRKKRNYSYVCGLMVMLVKISESRKGVEVFSMRGTLPIMLSELMLFAPQIVQMQVLETMEKTLRNFKPTSFDVGVFVQNMLAVIAKVITLQVKDRVTRKMITASLTANCTDIPSIWRAEKPICTEVVQLVIGTLTHLANDGISAAWSQAIRTELANCVMSINKILAAAGFLPSSSSNDLPMSSFSTSEHLGTRAVLFLRQPQFWLAVAAMTAIKDPSWLELSTAWRTLKARRSEEPEPPCENHDDGVTMARFHCAECELHLCYECFSVLHLNKRKKLHTAKLVGSTLMCPKLDVHEGCTRLRVNNFLILFNCTKLSGMAEISAEVGSVVDAASAQGLHSNLGGSMTGAESKGAKCRFCQNPLKPDETKTGVCGYNECQDMLKDACMKILPCGHWCPGISGEKECLPCFTCPSSDSKQDSDDLCVICFTDRLGGAPCVKLSCGHSFHYQCVKTILEKRWHGPRILFRFMQCPLCKSNIDHPALQPLMQPLLALYEDVKKKALLRLEYDGLLKVSAVTSEQSEFFNDPTGYALHRYVYVLCSKCNKAYFGGESRCQQALDSSSYKPEELVCGGCSDISGAPVCGRHGTEFLEYKCRFCCSVAVYFCFGNSHFCSICHSDFQRLIATPTNLLPQCPVGPRATQLENQDGCPLRVKHPPTGEEFSLGCGICRNLTTF
ncbi:unnamed protein product [Bursaphelenchus xylophilus]|uniref:RCR-type E3 ubiquitin transferase n=1 Tax=Bursaphelenchus xylophilus TaxID=6326 RepID=A0A1I7RMW6_BURXY|nr:unnamed protein product [Bursaphelenchus xylophilus]CAG9125391.1 unnamed protein product [Bursaphelenchus xylophilus]